MQFDYQQLMDTADISIPNAIGMFIVCEKPPIGFLPELVNKFGCIAVREALKDNELLRLMDAIEHKQNTENCYLKPIGPYEVISA